MTSGVKALGVQVWTGRFVGRDGGWGDESINFYSYNLSSARKQHWRGGGGGRCSCLRNEY